VPVALTRRSTVVSTAETTRTCRGGWRWASKVGAAAGAGLCWQPSAASAATMSANPASMCLAPAK
jgi:hypothetical protein